MMVKVPSTRGDPGATSARMACPSVLMRSKGKFELKARVVPSRNKKCLATTRRGNSPALAGGKTRALIITLVPKVMGTEYTGDGAKPGPPVEFWAPGVGVVK